MTTPGAVNIDITGGVGATRQNGWLVRCCAVHRSHSTIFQYKSQQCLSLHKHQNTLIEIVVLTGDGSVAGEAQGANRT